MKLTRKKLRKIIQESLNDEQQINEIIDPISLGIGALAGAAAVTLAPKAINWIKKTYNNIADPDGKQAAKKAEEKALSQKFAIQRRKNPEEARYLDMYMTELLNEYDQFVSAMYALHPEDFNILITLFVNIVRSSKTTLAVLDPNFLIKEGRLLTRHEFFCYLKGDLDPDTAMDLHSAMTNNFTTIKSSTIYSLGLEGHPSVKQYADGPMISPADVSLNGIAGLARYMSERLYQDKKEADPVLVDPKELMTATEKADMYRRKQKRRRRQDQKRRI